MLSTRYVSCALFSSLSPSRTSPVTVAALLQTPLPPSPVGTSQNDVETCRNMYSRAQGRTCSSSLHDGESSLNSLKLCLPWHSSFSSNMPESFAKLDGSSSTQSNLATCRFCWHRQSTNVSISRFAQTTTVGLLPTQVCRDGQHSTTLRAACSR